jgi:hypothetical protein
MHTFIVLIYALLYFDNKISLVSMQFRRTQRIKKECGRRLICLILWHLPIDNLPFNFNFPSSSVIYCVYGNVYFA